MGRDRRRLSTARLAAGTLALAAATAVAGEANPLELTLRRASTTAEEGRLATNGGAFEHAARLPVELTVNLGELVVEPQLERLGLFHDTGIELGFGAVPAPAGGETFASGDLDGDGDDDVFVPRRELPHAIFLNDGTGQFAERPVSPGGVGNITYDVRLGDLDDDGDLDAVLGTRQSSTDRWEVWINDGNAGFSYASAFLAGRAAEADLGDLDGDGDLDLVLAPGGGHDAAIVYLNVDNGFRDSGTRLTERSITTQGLADVDGDGDLDVVTGTQGGALLWLNEGGLRFAEPETLIETYVLDVAFGDLDGDGDPDVVLGTAGWGRVLLNDGVGGFGAPQLLRQPTTGLVQLIDVDVDGDLDASLRESLWLNDGTGTFHDTGQVLPLGRFVYVDADLAPDWVAHDAEATLWRNGFRPGSWEWRFVGADGPDASTVQLVAMASDGAEQRVEWSLHQFNLRPDVLGPENQRPTPKAPVRLGSFRDPGDDGPWQVSVDWGDRSTETFEVAAAGSLGARPHAFPGRGEYTVRVSVSEAEGPVGSAQFTVRIGGAEPPPATIERIGPGTVSEGEVAQAVLTLRATEAERAELTASAGEVERVGEGRRAVFFGTGQSPGSGHPSVGDLDGDGDLDAFVGERILLNRGDGTFDVSNQNLPRGLTGSRLADLDGDGDLDIFVTNHNANAYSLLNDGEANFTEAQALRIVYDDWSRHLALGDLNGDGRADAVIANFEDEYGVATVVYLNRGDGTFARAPQSLVQGKEVALGDLDGDGDLDAFIVGSRFKNYACFNGGDGFFTRCDRAPGDLADGIGVALGDLDGDGDLDAFVGNVAYSDPYYGPAFPGHDIVLLNLGDGSFAEIGQELGSSATGSVSLGDLDGDGDLDAWTHTIWLNDGNGRFEDSLLRVGSSRVELADLNGDGVLDALGSSIRFGAQAPAWSWTLQTEDGPETFDVTFTASAGGETVAATTRPLHVLNVAPTAELERLTPAECGQPIVFRSFGRSDPGPADSAAGFTTTFDVTPPNPLPAYRVVAPPARPVGDPVTLAVPAERGGTLRIVAEVTDKDGGSTTEQLTATIVDRPPEGEILFPRVGDCFGAADLPVWIQDDFRDACHPHLDRDYQPPTPGAGPYTEHGSYFIRLAVTDLGSNSAVHFVDFGVDLRPPVTTILHPKGETAFPDALPIVIRLSAHDVDGVPGSRHERLQLGGCTLFDGATFGDRDGLLQDEVVRLTLDDLCALAETCEWNSGDHPLTYSVTDCGGNTGLDTRTVQLDLAACATTKF